MKRDLKFRAKGYYANTWYHGGIVQMDDECNIIVDQRHKRVKADTVGQYIGRQDKNGNDVYEGDILRVNYKPGCYNDIIIEYNDERACFVSVNIDSLPMRLYTDITNGVRADWWKQFQPEIIGNIYDNPELIEQ